MIYAHISDASRYAFLGEVFLQAMKELAAPGLAERSAGTTVLVPGKAWYNIDEPQSLPLAEVPFESHREFVDVQMTLRGAEVMGCAPVSAMNPTGEYDEKEDIRYYNGEGPLFDCSNGMFAVFFPEDAHRPCVAADGVPAQLKKVVVKIHKSLIGA